MIEKIKKILFKIFHWKRMKKIKAIEEVAGMLNDMGEEEKKIFDEAVKRR